MKSPPSSLATLDDVDEIFRRRRTPLLIKYQTQIRAFFAATLPPIIMCAPHPPGLADHMREAQFGAAFARAHLDRGE